MSSPASPSSQPLPTCTEILGVYVPHPHVHVLAFPDNLHTVPSTRISIPTCIARILFPFRCSFRGTGPSNAFVTSITLASDGYPPSQFTLFTANPCDLLSSLFPIPIHSQCAEPVPLLSRPLPLPYSIPSAPHHCSRLTPPVLCPNPIPILPRRSTRGPLRLPPSPSKALPPLPTCSAFHRLHTRPSQPPIP